MKGNVSIIGSGFSSLAASCYLAKAGYDVTVYEKNVQLGGRARQFKKDGFSFDMGPTWYWMPDVFERFFNDFDREVSDYYRLEKLGPGYRAYFGSSDFLDISDKFDEVVELFEKTESGAGEQLRNFVAKAGNNYDLAIKDLVYKPGLSPFELVTKDTIRELSQFVSTISGYVHRKFSNAKLRQVLEFPALFLGAKPSDTPLFYSFMNYADLKLGTWYPIGGMRSVVEGIIKLARELGVQFQTGANVDWIVSDGSEVSCIKVNNKIIKSDIVVSGADYHHTESLLNVNDRNYKPEFWEKQVMSPSALLFYVGIDKKLTNVQHHTLFFDKDFEQHAHQIYDEPNWPNNPLFYASFPSITDASVAPEGKETAIFLIPLATDLTDDPELHEYYFDLIMSRLESLTGQSVADHVLFKKSYCLQDFKNDYNSYRGNAYGLSNILKQTAFLRPKIRNKKLKNLFYTGQLTVPGPGVPPAIISGRIVSDLIIDQN